MVHLAIIYKSEDWTFKVQCFFFSSLENLEVLQAVTGASVLRVLGEWVNTFSRLSLLLQDHLESPWPQDTLGFVTLGSLWLGPVELCRNGWRCHLSVCSCWGEHIRKEREQQLEEELTTYKRLELITKLLMPPMVIWEKHLWDVIEEFSTWNMALSAFRWQPWGMGTCLSPDPNSQQGMSVTGFP